MAKAASAEIGSKRFYHHVPPTATPCLCGDRIDPKCGYALMSVTTILDALPKPWLGPWAAKIAAKAAVEIMGNLVSVANVEGPDAALDALEALVADDEATEKRIKKAPWEKRDAAGARGTATHTAAELDTAIEDVPADVQGKVRAWHMWLDDYQPEILHKEATVYSPACGYAGTADLFVRLPHPPQYSGTWLIDIKTGVMSWTHRLQQAAYRFGLFIGDERGDYLCEVPRVDHVGILSLQDDGYSFYEIAAGTEEYDAFLLTARFGRMVADLERVKDRLVSKRLLQ
jgi:hypothetical protein